MFLDKIALSIVIIGSIYLGITGILNTELINYTLNHPLCFVKRFVFAITGVSGLWCCSFFFKFKHKKPIEIR